MLRSDAETLLVSVKENGRLHLLPECRVEHDARRRHCHMLAVASAAAGIWMLALTPQAGLAEVNVRSHGGEKVSESYKASDCDSSQCRKSLSSSMRKLWGGCLGVDSLPGR